MYKQVKTHETAILDNGVEFKPVATLESEAGGVCHISIDDHCYKLTLKQNDGRFKVTPYIFGEALEVLRRLPPLILDIKTIKMDVLNTELEMETRNYNTETGELGPELNTDFQTEREIIENCLFRARQLHFDGKTSLDTSIKELEDELYDRLFSYRDNKKETPLDRPAVYSLIDIFKELKFGRPAASQHYLDKCIKELNCDTDSGEDKLPNFKFTPAAPKDNAEEIKPYGYSKDESYEHLFNKKDDLVYGYILTAQHYEKAALAILDIDSFKNSDGVHVTQPENIKKLEAAGVLNNWFYPITKKDMDKFNANKIDEMSSGGKLMVKYLVPLTPTTPDDELAKNDLIKEGLGKTMQNRINYLRDVEEYSNISEIDDDIRKLVHKYYAGKPTALLKDINFSIRLIKDIIEHSQFYIKPN